MIPYELPVRNDGVLLPASKPFSTHRLVFSAFLARRAAFVLLLIVLFLSGCSQAEPVATATPTKTPFPAATAVPTATPVPPTATPVPTDTPTPLPTETPTPEGTATSTPTPAPAALLQPAQDGVNVRKGPGSSYGKLGTVSRSDTLSVFGKSEDGAWYQVCCINTAQGWVAAQFAQLNGDAAAVPVVAAPVLNAETQADAPAAVAVTSGSSAGSSVAGRVSIGNVVPAVDNPPPGRYFGLCGLNVNRPVREVAPPRTTLAGNINPLTGLTIDPALLQTRIFVARYGNEPAVNAYYGISAPDLVFEELMDSMNTTRFTTVWLGGNAPQIGPLRSFRSTTIQVAQTFDAPMASSGAVGPNQVFAYAAGIEDLDERCTSQPYFNNSSGGGYQNRVLTSSANLRSFLAGSGLNTGVKIKPFSFSDAAPGGAAATRVVIPYLNRGFYEVEWRYDPATGRYARFSGANRNPLLDGSNGQQVTAANVVIMEVQHDITDLPEDSVNGLSVRTYIVGREGPAIILRDGVAVQGRWRVSAKFSGLELVDAAGNAIPLKPGNSWFQVVPPNYGVTVVG